MCLFSYTTVYARALARVADAVQRCTTACTTTARTVHSRPPAHPPPTTHRARRPDPHALPSTPSNSFHCFDVHRKTNLILGVFLISPLSPVPQSRASREGDIRKVRGRFTPVPKVSTGAAKDFPCLNPTSADFEPLAHERARCWRRAATAVPRRRGLSRRRPVGQAQPQHQPQPRAAATMVPGRCASPFGLSRGKRSTAASAAGKRLSVWSAQSSCTCSDHQTFACLCMRGRGRKLVAIQTEACVCCCACLTRYPILRRGSRLSSAFRARTHCCPP